MNPTDHTTYPSGPVAYLLLTREFQWPGTPHVYKIGRSKNFQKRLEQYPKGTRPLLVQPVLSGKQAEDAIILRFKAIFNRRWDIGKEYFEVCDVQSMDDATERIKAHFKATVQPFLRVVDEPCVGADASKLKRRPRPPSGTDILAARDVRDSDEYQRLHATVQRSMANGEELCIWHRHLYKAYYGIDTVDEAFMRKHPPRCPGLAVLVCMLYPHLLPAMEGPEALIVTERKAVLIQEVLSALGFRSPFDTDHSFTSTLDEVYHERLAHTSMFQDFTKCIRLFSDNFKVPLEWTSSAVGLALRTILSACGLKLDHKRTSSWVAGKSVKASAYKLDAASVQTMCDLLYLKTRRSQGAAAVNGKVTVLMASYTPKLYGHLILPGCADDFWRGGDGRQ